ncbi:MAG TPA: TIGR03118 family protein [Acidobacteriaceae bacterium]|nr:TIGR03118 family protein [Acidobacteriaceae bacterium]
MAHRIFHSNTIFSAIIAVLLFPAATKAQSQKHYVENEYKQVNLVSNGYVAAKVTDPNLINPWGMVAGPTPVWISNQGSNTSTVYAISSVEVGKGALLTVKVPTETGGPNGPTGIVFNSAGNAFKIPSATGMVSSLFVFANLNGTISGWNPGSTGGVGSAVVAVDNQKAGAVYTGLALGMAGSDTYLYAINFTPQGGVEVYDSSFQPAKFQEEWNEFDSDDNLPKLPHDRIWRPYNIANIDGKMYVAYAAMPKTGGLPITHQGLGVVAAFTLQGKFIRVVAKGGNLDAPWGMVMAPAQFGKFSNDLLIGNFGNGRILAYSMKTMPDNKERDGENHPYKFDGMLRSSDHKLIENGFLWTLMFGNGVKGSDPHTLYITTGGSNQAKDGLLAAITPDQ